VSRQMLCAGALRGLVLTIAVEHHERASKCFSRWTLGMSGELRRKQGVQTAQT
jgi:hypothetical protein